jgi:YihY family inner membrane protein
MGQLERGLNRIYGIERDRPTLQKYGRACLFALSVGILLMVALACLAFGREVFAGTHSQSMNTAWAIVRWPLGLVLIAISITVLFRSVPRRCQPKLSWLAFGSGVSVVLWTLATVGLGVFYRLSATFGQTYGPLAGTVALLFWCFLTSVALFFGAAVVAQLEAVRAGVATPQDSEKVERSEPAAMAHAGSAS